MRHIYVALRIGLEYNVFDEAELDLETLLNGEYRPYYADSNMAPKYLLSEASYLAGGLHFLHHCLVDQRMRLLCCHTDLKPSSILIVRKADSPIGKWMFADFGISVIEIKSRSGSPVAAMYGDQGQASSSITTSTRLPREYRPPEEELCLPMSHGGEDRHKGDIWSFGCILLTLLSFTLGGVPLVKKLHTIRRSEGQPEFFSSTRDSGTSTSCGVKQEMKSWASQIVNHQRPWALEWHQLIFDNMLRVVPAQRHEAKQIQDDLGVIRSQAPTENVWHSLPPYLVVRPNSPSWTTSPTRPPSPSGVSLASSALNSGFQSSVPGPTSATTPNRGQYRNSVISVQTPPPGDFPFLSQRRSDSTGTLSIGPARELPIDGINLGDRLPRAGDIAVCSNSARVVFWHGQNIVIYSPQRSLFSRESGGFVTTGLTAEKPASWIHLSLSRSYIALARWSPSSTQVSSTHRPGPKRTLLICM
jgi:serine/threonine protein kinase